LSSTAESGGRSSVLTVNDDVPSQVQRRYRHVMWDWNGTLLDDVSCSVDLMNRLLGQHGLARIDLARYRAIFDFPIRVYYERAGFDLSSAGTFERLGREWMNGYEAARFTCPLQAGARDILEAIASAEITQSILSAYPRDSLQTIVEHHGLMRYFVRVLGLDDIWARSKLELGRCWLAELGMPLSQILLVGDTLHDLEVAQALGIDCILVDIGHQSPQRLRERTPRVCASLGAVRAIMDLPAAPASHD
jgi:phosphoglycolate phosphatase